MTRQLSGECEEHWQHQRWLDDCGEPVHLQNQHCGCDLLQASSCRYQPGSWCSSVQNSYCPGSNGFLFCVLGGCDCYCRTRYRRVCEERLHHQCWHCVGVAYWLPKSRTDGCDPSGWRWSSPCECVGHWQSLMCDYDFLCHYFVMIQKFSLDQDHQNYPNPE